MRIISIAISLLLLLSGCGMKSGLQQPAPVKAEIVRQADWEVEFRDVFFLDAKHGWIIGEKGTILYTSDGGTNWETQNSSTTARLNKMQFKNKKQGWIVGDEGIFLHTENGGENMAEAGSDRRESYQPPLLGRDARMDNWGRRCTLLHRKRWTIVEIPSQRCR